MTQQKRARIFEHPLAFGSFRNWLRLLWDNKDIDRKFIPRALIVALSTLSTSPLKIYESLRYSRKVKNTAIHPSPIFIIGHWRTGTTHLHNLLCQDRNHGYVSTFQAFAPGLCLVGERFIKRPFNKLAQKMHPTREIDNIPLSLDNPEEEDLAVACMLPYSYLHMYTFPRRARHYYETYITFFENLPEPTIARWKKAYLTMLRKATLEAGGKQLVIKNCADSARIKMLLELFPEAKFIHIYRNPYDVFRSTKHLYRVVLERSQLQEIGLDVLEDWVLLFYAQLMQKFLADKVLIPEGNLVEVKYEELDKEPLAQLRKIYETLSLPGFDEAEPAFRAYLDSIAGYQKLSHKTVDTAAIEKINERWGFVFDALGYERLEAGSTKQ
ncbi:MAG TPA: sulfotransferase [Dehalococcoidia bacterium]|nr:sulfotransferase [Dehalococcoidia bacterium]